MNQHIHREGLEFKKMVLGLEMWLIGLTKMIVLYTLAIVLGVFVQTLIIQLAFGLLKRYSTGLHALKNMVCVVVSCVLFVLVPFGLNVLGLGIGNEIVIPVFALVIICMYKYAPADTEARPIIGAKVREKLKLKAVICAVVLMAFALLVPDGTVKLLIMLGASYQMVSIHPLTYKILRRRERNYEKYELARDSANGVEGSVA